MATLHTVLDDDFLTFEHKGVKFRLSGTFTENKKWFHTVKNMENGKFAVMKHEDLKKIIPEL